MAPRRRPRPPIRPLTALAIAAAAAPLVLGPTPEPPTLVAVQVRPPVGPAEHATGVIIGRHRVLTVAHVLAGGGRVVVRGPDGVPRQGSLVRAQPSLDLAVLEVGGLEADAPRLADAGSRARILVRHGGRVHARPALVRRRVTARLVDQPGRPRRPTLELAADVRSGDSGSPVVDRRGRIIGIVYARSTRRGGTAYATRAAGLPPELSRAPGPRSGAR